MAWDDSITPVDGQEGSDGGDTLHAPSSPEDALPEFVVAQAGTQGTLCVIKFPVFLPDTDLSPLTAVDEDSETGHVTLPEEHWPVSERVPLLNIGGNRVVVVGQEMIFDTETTQFDENNSLDNVFSSWDFGDGDEAMGSLVTHTYDTPGTYTVVCTLPYGTDKSVTTRRYVRVLSHLGESDITVVGLPTLAGTVDRGWRATIQIAGASIDWVDFQGVAIYVFDDHDTSWRADFEPRMRDLARNTAFTAKPPPIPAGAENPAGGPSSPTPSQNSAIGDPTGSDWDAVNALNAQFLSASSATGVPPNLIKAHAKIESSGQADMVTPTGNATCPKAIGVMQIAQGCSWFTHSDKNLYDPAQNILAGAQEIRARFDNCGSWDGAIAAYFSGHCVPNGSTDLLGTIDSNYVRIVKENWAACDAAALGMGGASDGFFGDMLFNGYVVSGGIQVDSSRDLIELECVGTGEILDHLMRRQEAFFETSAGHTLGGTFMDAPPMRVASCIHHTLTEHSNFPNWHDVLLDWGGPRMEATTANEGTMISGFRAWASNDFARCFTDAKGRLRYEPHPSYRGKAWYESAIAIAPRIDPSQILGVPNVTIRNMAERVNWVKLSGTMPYRNCQVFGEFPCTGPPEGPAGQWVSQSGFQYDDAKVLCAMAAYHYAHLNRSMDMTLILPWRHDLELGDVITAPLIDPNGLFDFTKVPAYFHVTSISYQYNAELSTLLATISTEQLTYGVPCKCAKPKCHTPDQQPCDSCLPGGGSNGGNSGGDHGGRDGEPNCDGVSGEGAIDWRTWSLTQEQGDKAGGQILYSVTTGSCRHATQGYDSDIQISSPGPLGPFICFACTDTPEQIQEEFRPCQVYHDISGTQPNVVDTHVAVEGAGTQGILEAKRSSFQRSFHSIFGAPTDLGNEISLTTFSKMEETTTWIEVSAIGPVGSSRNGTLWLRPTAVTTANSTLSVATAAVVVVPIYETDAVVPAVDENVDLLTVDEMTHPLTSPEEIVVGTIAGLGISSPYSNFSTIFVGPAEIDGWMPFAFQIACSPIGKRFRIGLRFLHANGMGFGNTSSDGLTIVNSALVFKHRTWYKEAQIHHSSFNNNSGCPCSIECMPSEWVEGNILCYEGDTMIGSGSTPCEWHPEGHNSQGNSHCPDSEDHGYVDRVTTYRHDLATITNPNGDSGVIRCEAIVEFNGCVWEVNGVPTNGGGNPSDWSGGPLNGGCGNWPTAEAINRRIERSEQINGRPSALHGLGSTFLSLGQQYGINPGFVVAVLQRESQLGTDGSILPSRLNNFGGLTDSGTCGSEFIGGRAWGQYCNVADGLEANFAVFTGAVYTNTGGPIDQIMEIYAPAAENNVTEMWAMFANVAVDLGITLGRTTTIYASSSECQSQDDAPVIPDQPPGSGQTPFEWALHQVGSSITQGPGGGYSHSQCDCYDFGVPQGTPVYPILPGRVIVSEATSGVYTPNHVIIETAYGNVHYAHFSSRAVTVGQTVQLDTLLGYSGSAGTGPHLHLGLDGGMSRYTLNELLYIASVNMGSFPWAG